MKPIVPLHSPISEKVLIEASAGTGKTYTITSLVIRYLLGIKVEQAFKLDEILIVTFTKAATAELRVRIYERILSVNDAFKHGYSEDEFCQEILSIISPDQYIKARAILNEAERLMSDAHIFTIHGFCQRFLSQNPLDSHLPFDTKLVTSDIDLKTETAKQFWREVCYYFPEQLASIAYPIYKNPEHVQSSVNQFLSVAPDFAVPDDIESLTTEVFACQGDDGALDDKKVQALLWAFAAQKINALLITLKQKQGILFFDDLIKETEQLIQRATPEQLENIRARYKIAMIDEFQDTDRMQYEIFSQLFGHTQERSLLMIGDPKQSIYKFRGADIQTYLAAKRSATHHYTLDTNYRSATNVVEGINELFEQNPNPFLNSEIPFFPVKTPIIAEQNYLAIDHEQQKGIGIAYIAGGNNKSDFKKAASEYIANRIQYLLLHGQIHQNDQPPRTIRNQDITILVRDRNDAETVLKELRNLQLPAVYLSDQNRVFKSKAAELLHLFLTSLLDSRNQKLMKQTFASLLYQLSLNELHELLNNNGQYEDFLIERERCLEQWDQLGIIPMVDKFLHSHHRIHRFRNHTEFNRIMTDLRHLCELLQTQSLLSPTKEALLEWFTQQMSSPDDSDDEVSGSNSLRLESEMDVITIMTVHGSKGLEFPITFIPSNFEARDKKPPFIIDLDNGQKVISYDKNEEYEEHLREDETAENMRLLYVALTRAKYYCEFTLSEVFLSNKTNVNNKVVYSTLLNLSEGASFTPERLAQLQFVQVIPMATQSTEPMPFQTEDHPNLSTAEFTGKINRSWNISSFTQLVKNAPSNHFSPENLDESNLEVVEDTQLMPERSIFTFPKGAHTGTFIHELFEKHAPKDLLDIDYLTKVLGRTFFSEDVSDHLEIWANIIHEWLNKIFSNELLPDFTFSDALQTNELHELEFLFPVRTAVTADEINHFLQQYRQSDTLPALDFYTLEGMMKGFIDLIFMHNGKFYIVDYKTNYLGDQREDYSDANLHIAMQNTYYDVQYLIYSVALMRYLKFRMPNFNFDEHFGGIFYLFVRGMTEHGSDGVYFRKPSQESIEELNQIFGSHHE